MRYTEPVFVIYPPGPIALQKTLERFGFSNALERFPQDRLQKIKYPDEPRTIINRPIIEVVERGLFEDDLFHRLRRSSTIGSNSVSLIFTARPFSMFFSALAKRKR